MLEFNTGSLSTRKHVLIDGHEYTVRRMGNIEQLEMSQLLRRLNVLATQEKSRELTADELTEVEQISRTANNLWVSLFNDGGDGTKAHALVASLSSEDIATVMDKVFASDSPAETASK